MFFSRNMSTIIPIDVITLFAVVMVLLTTIFSIVVVKKIKRNRVKVISVWLMLWIVMGGVLFSTGTFGQFVSIAQAHEETYSKQALQEDLDQLAQALLEENPLTFSDENMLKQKFEEASQELSDGMTAIDFFRVVNPIVADVNCGHTNLQISEALQKNREGRAQFIPIKIALVKDQLYCVESDSHTGINAGDQIVSINGMASQTIIERLIDNISHDGTNEAKSRYILREHFNHKYYNFIDSSGNYTIETINALGEHDTVMIEGDYREEFNTSAWELHHANSNNGSFYDYQLYDDHAKLNIYVFNQKQEQRFDEFLDEFFTKVNAKGISKLIIDLRGNYGGTPQPAIELLSYLIDEPIDYFEGELPLPYRLMGLDEQVMPADRPFKGKVVVLMDQANFSTSGHLLALIKSHNLATLVGTKSSGGYVSTDSSKNLVLNNTRLRLHYSTAIYQVNASDLPAIDKVVPDVTVESTIQELLNNRDQPLAQGLDTF